MLSVLAEVSVLSIVISANIIVVNSRLRLGWSHYRSSEQNRPARASFGDTGDRQLWSGTDHRLILSLESGDGRLTTTRGHLALIVKYIEKVKLID